MKRKNFTTKDENSDRSQFPLINLHREAHLFCSKHEDYRRKQVLFGKHLPTILLARARIRAHQRVFVFLPSPFTPPENELRIKSLRWRKRWRQAFTLSSPPFRKVGARSRRTARSGAKKGNVNTCLHPAFTAKRLFSAQYTIWIQNADKPYKNTFTVFYWITALCSDQTKR